jgi:hypothetical protein
MCTTLLPAAAYALCLSRGAIFSNGQSREFHLLPSNSSGTHTWPRDPHGHAHDVYHCASLECSTYCGAAASGSTDNATCTSAPPPATQWPDENTGSLFASVSGHFNEPGVTIQGTVEFQWLHAPSPPSSPPHAVPPLRLASSPRSPALPASLALPPPSPASPLRAIPPSPASPLRAIPQADEQQEPARTLTPSSDQALHGSATDSAIVALAAAAGGALALAICCCFVVALCCCAAVRQQSRKQREAVAVAAVSSQATLHDLLGRPIPAPCAEHELASATQVAAQASDELEALPTTSTRVSLSSFWQNI